MKGYEICIVIHPCECADTIAHKPKPSEEDHDDDKNVGATDNDDDKNHDDEDDDDDAKNDNNKIPGQDETNNPDELGGSPDTDCDSKCQAENPPENVDANTNAKDVR